MKRESRIVDRSAQIDSPSQRHLPLVDLLVDTRAELMELAVNSGLKVLHTMLEEDRVVVNGAAAESGGSNSRRTCQQGARSPIAVSKYQGRGVRRRGNP
jgi:hypothetical protein